MNKAPNDFLNALHGELAKELMKRIKEGTATPADLNAARQFLKDNGIEARATPTNPLGQLAGVALDKLPFPQEGLQ